MNNKKHVLILTLAAMVLAGAGVVAGTALEIRQPVSAQVTISGIGSSPTFNLVDNAAPGTAGGRSGHIAGDDTYVVDFSGLEFGRAQTIQVGNDSDPVFSLQNKYAQNLIVRLEPPSGSGVVEDPESNGFFLEILGPGGNTWPGYMRLWIQSYGRLGSVGSILIPPGATYNYHIKYVPYGGSHPKAKTYHIPVKLLATNNDENLANWVNANLPVHDALFDPAGGKVYYKDGTGTVQTIDATQFDVEAWLDAWVQSQL